MPPSIEPLTMLYSGEKFLLLVFPPTFVEESSISFITPGTPLPLKCKNPSPSVVTIRPVSVTLPSVKLPARLVNKPSPEGIDAPENM